MKKRTDIKDFYGKILGSIETDTVTGDKVARNFYGRILGYYYSASNTTRAFNGSILAQGDILASLIQEDSNKN